MNNIEEKFIKFLDHVSSQTEISLGIAKDDQELEEFKRILNEKKFKGSNDILALMSLINKPHKNYLVLDKNFDKNSYDFLIQYPTGQVEIFNREKMTSEIGAPHHAGSVIVFLVTSENLSHIQKKGFDILANVGLTYQN